MAFKYKKGFTLIEFMVAVAITSILVLLMGVIHVTSVQLFIKGGEKVLLQEESSFAFEMITEAIRDTTEKAEILDSGSKLKLTRKDENENIEWEKIFYKDGDSLSCILNGGAKKVLVPKILHSVLFSDKDINDNDLNGAVRIKITLQKGSELFSSEKTVDMRNYGLKEVYYE